MAAGGRGSDACGRSRRRTRSSVVAGSARSMAKCVTAVARVVAVGRHARAHAPVAPDRRVDRAAARGRAALDERQVLALDLAALQRGLQAPVRLARARDDEQPRGVAVEAVDDPRPPLLPAARDAGQRLGERARGVPARRVHDDAGRLVDDEQVLVLVGHGEVGGGGDRRAAPRRGRSTVDRLPRAPPGGAWARRRRRRAPRPTSIRRCAREREPSGPARKASRRAPSSSGAGAQLHRARGRSAATITPSVIDVSATLKAGQCGTFTKSVTAPSRTRSMTLPSAPPSSIPVGSQASGRCTWVAK